LEGPDAGIAEARTSANRVQRVSQDRTVGILDFERLDALNEREFLATKPYPWINPAGVLTPDGYRRLIETAPPVEQFDQVFGKTRSYGQQSHDRLALEYNEDVELAEPWREFLAELKGPRYEKFLRRMLGRGGLSLSFHWHYTPNGCGVSPHCDAVHKLGSHIFYLNTEEDWHRDWGGETLVLDDHGRFDRKSAPSFEDFDSIQASETDGNHSLLFARNESSWHGVRTVNCPEGRYRKVFIVVINDRFRMVGREFLRKFSAFARGKTDRVGG
jgi:hypothetical protein